ncbi:MAG: SMI1/KNR4 family protein, partial [Polyangiales bacterium]
MTLKLVTGRIDKARARVEALKDTFAIEGPTVGAPIATADVAAIEGRLGLVLPRPLRDFYTKVGASYRWGWRSSFGSGLLALVDAHDLERHVLAREKGRVTLLRLTDDGEGGGYALDRRERGFDERISFCDARGDVRGVSPNFGNFVAIWAAQAFVSDRAGDAAKI